MEHIFKKKDKSETSEVAWHFCQMWWFIYFGFHPVQDTLEAIDSNKSAVKYLNKGQISQTIVQIIWTSSKQELHFWPDIFGPNVKMLVLTSINAVIHQYCENQCCDSQPWQTWTANQPWTANPLPLISLRVRISISLVLPKGITSLPNSPISVIDTVSVNLENLLLC